MIILTSFIFIYSIPLVLADERQSDLEGVGEFISRSDRSVEILDSLLCVLCIIVLVFFLWLRLVRTLCSISEGV